MFNRGAGSIAKQVEKGVNELRQVSRDVQIAVCTVPEVQRRGFHTERTVVEVYSEIWKLSKALGFAVIDVNGEVHYAGPEVDIVCNGKL